MNASTIQHLADLKKAGFDTSSLENQMRSSPILDKRGDQLMGGGILRQAAFTKITQDRAKEKETYEQQISELRSMQTAGVSEESPLYKAALEVIAEQEKLLIDAGFTEDDVKKLSEKAVKAVDDKTKIVQSTTTKEPPVQTKIESEGDMAVDTSNFLDLDTFQQQSEQQIFGNASLAAIINRKLAQADKLGIEVPFEKAANLGVNLRQAISQGKQIEQFLDEDLGIATKQKEVDDANRQKEISDAEARGRAAALKEVGAPRRVVTRTDKHPIYDNINSSREVVQPQQQENSENKEVPTNKWGDKEIFRTRGDKFSRVQAAEDYHEKVLERTAAQNSIPSE